MTQKSDRFQNKHIKEESDYRLSVVNHKE